MSLATSGSVCDVTIMLDALHIWIGNPKSTSDLSFLMASLRRLVPGIGSELEVVYEDRLLSIPDLATGFTGSFDAKEQLAARANDAGFERATAMFGVKGSAKLSELPSPNGLHYLGSVALDEDEASEAHVQSGSESLYRAVLEGKHDIVKEILNNSANSVQETNEIGHTPLMASATTERPEITELLLSVGAPVDVRTSPNGYNALHWALHHPPHDETKVLRIVKILLERGLNVNEAGTNGVTPLMLAAWFGAQRVVAFLLEQGAKKETRDANGKTAREMAIQRRNSEIAHLLG